MARQVTARKNDSLSSYMNMTDSRCLQYGRPDLICIPNRVRESVFSGLSPYITSGLKWCSRAQKARPFLHEVVKLVIFTPR